MAGGKTARKAAKSRRTRILSWRRFSELRGEIRRDRAVAARLADDPDFSPLGFKLTEAFWAGLPAGVISLALAGLWAWRDVAEGGLTRQALGGAAQLAAAAAVAGTVSGFALPAGFLVAATFAAWPLAPGRASAHGVIRARRIYLIHDGALGLWPQMLAAIGLAVAAPGWSEFLASSGGGEGGRSEIGPGLGLALTAGGLLLAAPGLLLLLYVNGVRAPALTAAALGARGGLALAGRLLAHFLVLALAACILTPMASLLIYVLRTLTVAAVAAALGAAGELS